MACVVLASPRTLASCTHQQNHHRGTGQQKTLCDWATPPRVKGAEKYMG